MNEWLNFGVFGSVMLKVTPDKMYSTSDQVLTKINMLKRQLEEVDRYVKNTSSYWQGEVSDKRRNAHRSSVKDVDLIIKRWMEHVSELKLMAGNYIEAEGFAKEEASSLPVDVIR